MVPRCDYILLDNFSWHNLLEIGILSKRTITAEFLPSHDIPEDITRSTRSVANKIAKLRLQAASNKFISYIYVLLFIET